jgi:hypothetical protein
VNVEKSRVNNVAVVAATRHKAERVAIKVAHHAHDQLALRPGRNFSRGCLLVALRELLLRYSFLALQQVRVNAGLAVRNNNRTDRLLIKAHRTGRADDRVNVSHLSQRPSDASSRALPMPFLALPKTPVGPKNPRRVHS